MSKMQTPQLGPCYTPTKPMADDAMHKEWRATVRLCETDEVIADVYGATREEAKARARQFAVMPELLEALQRIVKISGQLPGDSPRNFKLTCNLATSAIAKATKGTE